MIHLRLAEQEDIETIDTLLRALSEELGDHHVATIDTLRQAGFGEHQAFHAQLAFSSENNTPMGIALYSPLFSTTSGGSGLYLSDLWVAPEQRGTRLGSRLIAAAASDAAERWQARFVKLSVYQNNLSGIAFYDRLGFTASKSSEHYLVLNGDALATLIITTKAPEKLR